MDRRRFSQISHLGIRFWNPLDEGELVQLVCELQLPEGAEVLDYGCGEGELLVELSQRHGARVTGLDVNEEAVARCRQKLAGTFFAEAFRPERFPSGSFDLIVNIGASPGMNELLEQVCSLLRPGGRVLIGDLYWQRPPSIEYLTFLGETGSTLPTHEDHLQSLAKAGLGVERTLVASLADWDRYEDRYDANMIAYLRANPGAPEAAAFEARRSKWREMYLMHGRGTMGFALYQARISAG